MTPATIRGSKGAARSKVTPIGRDLVTGGRTGVVGERAARPDRQTSEAFVGRQREMNELRRSLEDPLAGRGRLVLLAGEPGIGKTRLAQEISTLAQGCGFQVLWGRCHEDEGAPPYWPWVQILRAHVRSCDTTTVRTELGPGAEDVAQIVADLRERFPDLPVPPAMEPAAARFRLFDSVTTFLKNAADRQPLVLVLDDLHWADTPSLLLLEFLARELEPARLLVVATYRDVEVGPQHPLFQTLGEMAREPVSRLVLRGFDQADLERYVETTTGATPNAELLAAVLRETNGNPFFVGQVVRLLVAEGGVERLRQPASGVLRVPEQAREVIGRRLGRLSAECNEVLRLAAVIGRSFDVTLLGRSSDVPRERVLGTLEEAIRIRMIAPEPESLAGYRFAHALVRETLYEALPITLRAALHHRVGEAAEDLFGADAPRHVAVLAHHFFEAVRGGGDVGKAIAYSKRAGERADQLLAFEDAVRHYERALQLLNLSPDACDDRERLALLRALGAACLKCDIPPERQMATLQSAVEVAERIGDPELQAKTALEYHEAVTWSPLAETGVQVPTLERALTAMGPTDSALVVWLLAALVLAHRNTARQRLRHAQAALAMADRIGDLEAQRAALAAMHAALLGPEWTDERVAIGIEKLQVVERLGVHAWQTWFAYQSRVYDLCETGDMVALDAIIEVALGSIDRARTFWLRVYEPLWRGMRAAHRGRFEEAERHAFELLALVERTRHRQFQGAAGALLWEVRRAQGRLAEIDAGTLATPLPEDTADRRVATALCAIHHLEMDREAEARGWFDQLAADDFRDIEMGFHFLPTMAIAAIAAHRLQDRARAAILYGRLRPYAGRNVVFGYGNVCFGSVSTPLGLLAATLGRFDAAARHFEDAIAFERKTGGRPAFARAQSAYAAMLHARGRMEDADKLQACLSEAVRTFEQLGMMGDLKRALALQSRVAGGPISALENFDRSRVSVSKSTRTPVQGTCLFRQEGDYWTIAYDGGVSRLRATKGLQYIAHLLRHPREEFHVLDLVQGTALRAQGTVGPAQGSVGNQRPETTDQGLPVLDGPAKSAYRRRLADLREELEEAERFNDPGRAERAQAEIDCISEQLAAAVGLGGRDRLAASAAERARSTVRQAIRTALENIKKELPALGDHLTARIKTGAFCVYRPDAARPVDWLL